MPEEKSVKIVIDEDGNTAVEAFGFHGPGCKNALREIEAALGERTGGHLKPEAFQAQAQQERRPQANG